MFGQIDQSRLAINHIMGQSIGLIPLAAIGTTALGAAIWPTILPAILAIILPIALPARLLLGGHFAHRFGQKPRVMFGMLQEILGGDTVI